MSSEFDQIGMPSKLREIAKLLNTTAQDTVAKLEVGEAIIYLAYGRLPGAARRLAEAIDKDPRNQTIRRAPELLEQYRKSLPFYMKPLSELFGKS